MKFARVPGIAAVGAILSMLLFVAGFALTPAVALAKSDGGKDYTAGHVYVLDNTTPTNSISVFDRAANGSLTLASTVYIGGQGTGSTLGSQGSLQLSANGHWLFAVDAGSNQLSVLRVDHQGNLTLASVSSSNGVDPVSVTFSFGRLYVVNDGDSTHAANVAGFWLNGAGRLTALPGATQLLSAANPAAGEIRANPDGRELIVTEKGTNTINAFRIFANGRLGNRVSIAASGATPYGFAFSPVRPNLFVTSDAAADAVTSYSLNHGAIQAVDGPVADQQTAPCWLVISGNGRYVYTANAGSGSVSTYDLSNAGKLALEGTVSTGTGSKPVEMTLTHASDYLYTLDTGTNSLSGFRVQGDGSLISVQLGTIVLSAGSTGIVAD